MSPGEVLVLLIVLAVIAGVPILALVLALVNRHRVKRLRTAATQLQEDHDDLFREVTGRLVRFGKAKRWQRRRKLLLTIFGILLILGGGAALLWYYWGQLPGTTWFETTARSLRQQWGL